MAALQTPAQLAALPAWERLFYDGERLRAEATLFADAVVGNLQLSDLSAGCAQIHRSHGAASVNQSLSAFAAFQTSQPEPLSHKEGWKQFLPVADLPDALLFWVLHRRLPELAQAEPSQRILLLQRLAMLLHQKQPNRPDLPYQVMMHEAT